MEQEMIRMLARIMKEEGLTKLTFKDKNSTIKLESIEGQGTYTNDDNNSIVSDSEEIGENIMDASQNRSEIRATQVGVLSFTSPDDVGHKIKEGDIIKKGQKIGSIEAMKVFNDLVSHMDGIIEKIHVNDESFVEYDELLITIKAVE